MFHKVINKRKHMLSHIAHSLSWFFGRDVSWAWSPVCYLDKCDFNFMLIAQFAKLMIVRKLRNNESVCSKQWDNNILLGLKEFCLFKNNLKMTKPKYLSWCETSKRLQTEDEMIPRVVTRSLASLYWGRNGHAVFGKVRLCSPSTCVSILWNLKIKRWQTTVGWFWAAVTVSYHLLLCEHVRQMLTN